jgi:invasion protein IalB
MTFPVRSISHLCARLAVSTAAIALAVGTLAFEASAQTAPVQPKPVQPKTAQPAQPQAGQQPQADQQGQQAPQQAQVTSTPWTKICNTDPQAKKEICLITQELRADTGQFLASVAIREIQGDPKKTFIIATPWGMQLQPGLRVVLDQQPPANAKYAVCFPNACYGDMEINADFVKKMKGSQALTVQTLNQANRTVSFTMPLAGFAKAYDGPALDPKTVEEQQKKLQDVLVQRAQELKKKLDQGGEGQK